MFYGKTFSSPVVGYTNDPESLRIDEDSDRTLTVGFLKPPIGAIGGQIIAPFLINNTQNTGSLYNTLEPENIWINLHIYMFYIRIHLVFGLHRPENYV